MFASSVPYHDTHVMQAGSEALSRYITAKGQQAKPGATLPEQIDQALQRLHATMGSCEVLLTRLQAAAADLEQVHISNAAGCSFCAST